MYLNVFRHGNEMWERYVGSDGLEHARKVLHSPTYYIHSKKNTGYVDIYKRNVEPVHFDTISDAYRWKKSVAPTTEILGMDDETLSYIGETYTEVITPQFDKIRIGILDIEVPAKIMSNPNTAPNEIKSVVYWDSFDARYYIFGVPHSNGWDRVKSILSDDLLDNVTYYEYPNEKALLIGLLRFINEKTPAIISGWNVELFDMPYIYNRVERVLGETALTSLSPWRIVNKEIINDAFGNETTKISIAGIAILDYLPLYRKFRMKPQPSYKLDYVCQDEIGSKKTEFTQENYLDFYQQDYQLMIDYNVNDVKLVVDLDKKIKLLMTAINVAYSAKINFDDVFGTVKPWDAIIYNSLAEKRIVIPQRKRAVKVPYMGGYVKPPLIGLHKDVESVDFTSLYPSCIMQCNISPETKRGRIMVCNTVEEQVDRLASGNFDGFDVGEFSASANGILYARDVIGVVPSEINKVFSERKKHKKLMLQYENQIEEVKAEIERRKRITA